MRNGSRYIKGLIFGITASMAALTAGCVPQERTSYMESPDLTPHTGVSIDFVQVHNDVMDAFDEDNPYIFITNVNIDGTNEPKAVTITATCIDDAELEDAEAFASAIIRRTAGAISVQSAEYNGGDQESFGNVWDDFSLKFTVKKESAPEGEYLLDLDIPAGGEIPLDPDYETYEESYIEQRDMRLRNTVIKADS